MSYVLVTGPCGSCSCVQFITGFTQLKGGIRTCPSSGAWGLGTAELPEVSLFYSPAASFLDAEISALQFCPWPSEGLWSALAVGGVGPPPAVPHPRGLPGGGGVA